MQIRLVWPRLIDSEKLEKPTTFFWLECNPEEAIDVLEVTPAVGKTHLKYAFAIQAAQEFLLSNPHQKSDDFYDPAKVGLLISSDGRTLLEADQILPVDPMWDPYGPPFVRIQPVTVDGIAELWEVGDYIFSLNPWASDQIEWDGIPERFDINKLSEIDIEDYSRGLPESEDEGLKATDDRLAMAIFAFMDSPTGAFRQNWQREGERLPADLVIELGRQYQARGDLEWWKYESSYPFPYELFSAEEMSLYEIYQRRARAEFNLQKLLWATETHRTLAGAVLTLFSNDEICELLLLCWTYQASGNNTYIDFLKPALFTLGDRMRPTPNNELPWYQLEFYRLQSHHLHFPESQFELESSSESTDLDSLSESIIREFYENREQGLGSKKYDHLSRVVHNVRSYELFVWEHDLERLWNQGCRHVSQVIDYAVSTAWLQELGEVANGDPGSKTLESLRDNNIPIEVIEAVSILGGKNRSYGSLPEGLRRAAIKMENTMAKFQEIHSNEVARIVFLSDMAARSFESHTGSGNLQSPTQAIDTVALAHLHLTDDEWKWFNSRLESRN